MVVFVTCVCLHLCACVSVCFSVIDFCFETVNLPVDCFAFRVLCLCALLCALIGFHAKGNYIWRPRSTGAFGSTLFALFFSFFLSNAGLTSRFTMDAFKFFVSFALLFIRLFHNPTPCYTLFSCTSCHAFFFCLTVAAADSSSSDKCVLFSCSHPSSLRSSQSPFVSTGARAFSSTFSRCTSSASRARRRASGTP